MYLQNTLPSVNVDSVYFVFVSYVNLLFFPTTVGEQDKILSKIEQYFLFEKERLFFPLFNKLKSTIFFWKTRPF